MFQVAVLTWCGLVGRKPCLPAFMVERKVSYQLKTLNRWIIVFTLYLNDDLMNHLAVQTNLKAEQFLHSQLHATEPRWYHCRKYFYLVVTTYTIWWPPDSIIIQYNNITTGAHQWYQQGSVSCSETKLQDIIIIINISNYHNKYIIMHVIAK